MAAAEVAAIPAAAAAACSGSRLAQVAELSDNALANSVSKAEGKECNLLMPPRLPLQVELTG